MAASWQETQRGRTHLKDQPQTFVAYSWGAFQGHRDRLYNRTCGVQVMIIPKIRDVTLKQFGMGAPIFPGGRFPGRYLDLLPR